ncbi:hypothetical protein IKM_05497 [Bacillus mycoides]|nr:hypothetical protein IKM_05497 [Bacillus mycoides]
MKTSLLLLYIYEWLQKEGMVAVPHRHQAKEIELTKIRTNSSPTMEYWVFFTQY